MNIQYIEPIERAWKRTRAYLFEPFELSRWVVVGFAFWVAGILDSGGGGSVGTDADNWEMGRRGWSELRELWWILPLIATVAFFALIVGLVLLWLSSRFKFVVLHDIYTGRDEIAVPFREQRHLGTSLFLWRLGFALAVGLAAASMAGAGSFLAWSRGGHGLTSGLMVAAMVVAGVLLACCAVLVSVLMEHFVIPIMYDKNERALAAWDRFFPILQENLLPFAGYIILLVISHIAVVIAVLLTILFTCGTGLILLVPILGTILLLPLHLTWRWWGIEFLDQFLPGIAPIDVPPPPPPVEPAERVA